VSDGSNPEQKAELLKQISLKFQDTSSPVAYYSSGAVPSLEYEQMRRRVTTNVAELWNYMNSELNKIENSMKNEIESQQSLKLMKNFMEMAREHKR
jgi:hypothetical protein